MKYFPYEKMVITSAMSAEDALKKLEENIEPKRIFRWGWADAKRYQGSLDQGRFNITRIISYRNSFLPVIQGEVQPEVNGCTVRISMRLHLLVLVFMLIWFGGIGLSAITAIVAMLSADVQTGSTRLPFFFIPLVMILFGYLLAWGGFKYESRKSKAFFRELFQAQQ